MAQVSVIPATTRPIPTKPGISRNHGLTAAAKALPIAASTPATMRTCRSIETA